MGAPWSRRRRLESACCRPAPAIAIVTQDSSPHLARPTMRSVLLAAAGLICLASPALPQQAAPQPDIPVVHYKAETEWPKPPLGDKGIPTLWNYIQVAGVAVARNGNILVLHRGDNPILEFRPNGDLVGPWGKVKFDSG